jgi:exopolysaccharide biosynthesis protein
MTAATRFIQACTPAADAGDSMSVSFADKNALTGLHIPEGTNSLVLDSANVTEMAPGVVYEERLYHDPNGKPVRAYMITVEKGAATIATSLPGDKEKIGTYANVLAQVKSAADHGKNVIAGINADFFGNTMEGLCVRDGVELHDYSGRPWFGITKDGEAVLGTPEEFAKYQGKLVTGVGGSNVVINNDYVSHISVDHEFGYTRHPRTAVGIKADGSTVLLVVDGRQSKISNGAALADLADILGSLGCIEALNLDGGGSSTFVLKDQSGQFVVTNSPSDGSLRDVADGLMVILP